MNDKHPNATYLQRTTVPYEYPHPTTTLFTDDILDPGSIHSIPKKIA